MQVTSSSMSFSQPKVRHSVWESSVYGDVAPDRPQLDAQRSRVGRYGPSVKTCYISSEQYDIESKSSLREQVAGMYNISDR